MPFFFSFFFKEPGYWVKIRHLEYKDGGILDPDDIVADVVEDKDKVEHYLTSGLLHFSGF